MTIPSWTDMQFYHYLIVAGAVVVVFALVLYFTPISRLKVPAILMGIAGGLGAGAALGVIAMGMLGYHWEPRSGSTSDQPSPDGRMMMMAQGGPGGMRGGGGAGRGGRGGGGGGANSKNRLASVINKLDLVTKGNGLKVTMDPEQKRKVREQIEKLDGADDLTEEEASDKLNAVLGILSQEQKDTLSAAGANWGQQGGNPGGGRGGRGGTPPPPNPFKEGEPNRHLKSLRDQMGEKQSK